MTPPRRVVTLPAYTIPLAIVTVLAACGLTLLWGVSIAKGNSAELIARYEADKVATQQQNTTIYCELFGSQLDAFADATTPTGRKSYEAWLAVYRLVNCAPAR